MPLTELERIALFTNGEVCSNSIIMTERALFSRGQTCTLAGVDTILLGSWLRDGLIRSIEVGDRKHRRFPRIEVMLTAFLREARNCHLNVAAMRALTMKIRDCVALFEDFSFSFDELLHADGLRYGLPAQEVFEAYDSQPEWQSRAPDLKARATKAAEIFPFDRWPDWRLGYGFCNATGIMMVWQDSTGKWLAQDSLPQDERMPAASVVVFQWENICAIAWDAAGAR
ncbi:hypothetical protein KRZ98_09590 [Sphingobium sp. AS12]|uniref:hypothetical protein n=1 Tax=Sphingobium sp. AS12 TaxID=2849495 RepID=UPI001C319E17|nr:hypothetical protein [Sphingobium sp. AS12]MBV2148538.1 hypothetical protein [Sphingobium sp. AS12]